jgi:3-hydroxyacyl-CoA dehydrogenase
MSSPAVTYERRGTVGVILVKNPPVNALAAAVRQGLADCLAQGNADAGVTAMVLAGDGRTFIAGADIREFGKPPSGPGLNDVNASYETNKKPVIAAIHGTALGGGLEVALSCASRVAIASAKVGLPEINLGLLPGAGGTQRLPRVVGPAAALEMVTSGRHVPAKEALSLGVVDKIVEGNDLAALIDGACAYAAEYAKKPAQPPVSQRQDKVKPGSYPADLFTKARADFAKKARGQDAPQRCIDAVEAGATLPFPQGLAKERELFLTLMGKPQSRSKIHAFFSEREAAKVPGVDEKTPTRPIKKVAVIGAGTMGGGIAMSFANAGIPVVQLEMTQEAHDRGRKIISGNWKSQVERGRLSQEEMDKRLSLITPVLDYKDIADCDMVVEAVFEEMDIKKQVFAKLDTVMKPGAILASNTSTLDVNEIAAVTKRPQDVVGMHYFSPANVMRLLEIVRGDKTAPDVLKTAMDIAKKTAKLPVVVGVCDGFVGNRMLARYGAQAQRLIEEGAMPWDVDRALTNFGLAMGPFAMGDLAGLDVGWRIRKRRAAEGKGESSAPITDAICELGRFGQKTSGGWYNYDKGSRTPIPSLEVEKIITEAREKHQMRPRKISDEEIVKRCMYALVNEGALILEEGKAYRASDIDAIYLNGYGFPAWRGGPMFDAEIIGLDKVLADIKDFAKSDPKAWKPAPLLEKLVAEKKSFYGK